MISCKQGENRWDAACKWLGEPRLHFPPLSSLPPLSLLSPSSLPPFLLLPPSVRTAVSNVNQAIESGSLGALLRALETEDVRLNNVVPENMQWYMDVLSKAMKDKAEVCAYCL